MLVNHVCIRNGSSTLKLDNWVVFQFIYIIYIYMSSLVWKRKTWNICVNPLMSGCKKRWNWKVKCVILWYHPGLMGYLGIIKVGCGGRGVDLCLEWRLKQIFEIFGDSYFTTFVMKIIFYYLVNVNWLLQHKQGTLNTLCL